MNNAAHSLKNCKKATISLFFSFPFQDCRKERISLFASHFSINDKTPTLREIRTRMTQIKQPRGRNLRVRFLCGIIIRQWSTIGISRHPPCFLEGRNKGGWRLPDRAKSQKGAKQGGMARGKDAKYHLEDPAPIPNPPISSTDID